jgi:ribose 5-phosphate isomerase B
MDRDRIREEVRAVLAERLAPPAAPSSAAAAPASWRRFDEARDPRGRALVTQADVMRARAGAKELAVPEGAIVTPLARETAGRLGVALKGRASSAATSAPPAPAADPAPAGRRTVALAADHGGYALKELLKPFLAGLGHEVIDLGTRDASPVDYPDFSHQVARTVAEGRAALGIMVDSVGVGSAMAANRHRGVRAAPCSTTLQAASARAHNDANVLTLGARHLGEDAAKAVVKAFLEGAFEGGRHAARVGKIEAGGA